MTEKKTVAFHTLGCKLNYAETSTMVRSLESEGFGIRPFDGLADIYVLNTCSVTEQADRECRHLVRRIQRRAPESVVVVTGCYAQLQPEAVGSIPGVDLVLGAAEKFQLARHLRELCKGEVRVHACERTLLRDFHPAQSVGSRTRSFVKVQDGCDYQCSFCTIPAARGQSRSDTIAGVLQRVDLLAREGVREVVLTGVNLGDFGRRALNAAGESLEDFLGLLQALDTHEGIARYRISSIEPNLLSEDIIRFVAQSRRIMPHFHIPLQSGSDRILGKMRRRYKRALYAERIACIRKYMPHCGIGADVIVGFPGETEDDFAQTYRFLEALDISYLHVFSYSERAGTPAAEDPEVVPIPLRQARNRKLRTLSYLKAQTFRERHQGQTRPVLFESAGADGMMEGYTDNYIRVSTPYQAAWWNHIVDWKI